MSSQVLTIDLDRSRIETRLACEMKRYLQYHFSETGMVQELEPLATAVGTAVHEGQACLLLGDDIEAAERAMQIKIQAALPADIHLQAEQFWISQMFLHGWQRQMLPFVQANGWELLDVEKPQSIEILSNGRKFKLRLRFDHIYSTPSGGIVIGDFKTLSGNIFEWDKIMRHSLQTLLYSFAAAHIYDKHVDSIIYWGLVKGRRSYDEELACEIQSSPLCYASYDAKRDIIHTRHHASRARMPVWQLGVTPDEWLARLQADDRLDGLFPIARVTPEPAMVATIVAQIAQDEAEFADKLVYAANQPADSHRTLFTMNPKTCYAYGTKYPCPYYGHCWLSQAVSLDTGFTPRQDHHALPEPEELMTDD